METIAQTQEGNTKDAQSKFIIHIQSFPKEATPDLFENLFSKYGKVLNVEFTRHNHVEDE
jgi:hypothetical protein